MSLPKLFQRIIWHNNTTPAINEDNLNAMSKGIDDIDDRVIELAADFVQAIADCTNAAEAAENSATSAGSSASAAASSATQAATSATSAGSSATSAGTSAQTATQAATSAQASATSADYSATSAGTSAQTATQAATSATASAAAAEAAAQAAVASTTHPPYIGQNGNWYIWDTTQEDFVDSGIDASITVTMQDITMLPTTSAPYITNTGTSTDPVFHLFIPQGAGVSSVQKTGSSGLVDTYTITLTDGSTTAYQITNGKGAYAYAVEGGYQGTEAEFTSDLGSFDASAAAAASSASAAATSATSAGTSATSAQADALKSEGFATGQQNGQDVPSTSPYYENNAKYWSDLAAQYAQSFSGLRFMGSISYSQIPVLGMTNGEMYDINEAFVTDSRFEEGAGISCAAGTDIVWVELDNKWNILTPSGVYSFNGRQGAVSPASGDYAASDISYGSGSNVAAALADKEKKSTILTATLSAGSTTVTITGLPTTGNNIIDFYTSTGINYTAISTATAGQVTLTYDAQATAVTVYCKIMEV